MKRVEIFGPTIVEGEVRHPFDNPLTVSVKEAKRLHDIGALVGEPVDVDAPTAVAKADD